MKTNHSYLILFLIFTLSFHFQSFANRNEKIDFIDQLPISDTLKIQKMYTESLNLMGNNLHLAKEFGEYLIAFGDSVGLKEAKIYGLNILSSVARNTKDFATVAELCDEQIDLMKTLGTEKALASIIVIQYDQAVLFTKLNQYKRADSLFTSILQQIDQESDFKCITLLELARVKHELGQGFLADSLLECADQIPKEMHLMNRDVNINILRIERLYSKRKFQECINIGESCLNDTTVVISDFDKGLLHQNLGVIYGQLKQVTKSNEHLLLAIQYFNETGYQSFINKGLLPLFHFFQVDGGSEFFLKDCVEKIQLRSKQMNDTISLAYCEGILASVNLSRNNLTSAVQNIKLGIAYSYNHNDSINHQFLRLLEACYDRMEEPENRDRVTRLLTAEENDTSLRAYILNKSEVDELFVRDLSKYYWFGIITLFCIFLLSIYFISKKRSKLHKQRLKIDAIHNQFTDLIIKKETYCDSNFSSQQAAAILKISNKELNMFAFDKYNVNYNVLINQLRVTKATELLKEDKTRTSNYLGEKVGYTNRMSFSTAFKQHTGKTVTNYRSEL